MPLVVKGATGAGGPRVWIVETVAKLAGAILRARRAGGAWGVQELVEGPTVLLGGVFHDGSPLRPWCRPSFLRHLASRLYRLPWSPGQGRGDALAILTTVRALARPGPTS